MYQHHLVMMVRMVMGDDHKAKSRIGMDGDGSSMGRGNFRILSEVQASELASCARPPPCIAGEASGAAPSCMFTL